MQSGLQGCYFPLGENRRHSRGLGWGAPVSGRRFPVFRSCGAGFGRRSLLAVFQFPFRRCRDRFDSGQRAVCRAPFRTRRTPAGSPRPRKTLVSIYNVFELAARRSCFDCVFASHYVAASNDANINRWCYKQSPICSCSAHEYGRALARPVTVRSVGFRISEMRSRRGIFSSPAKAETAFAPVRLVSRNPKPALKLRRRHAVDGHRAAF
jgi:hypothetical protein